MKYHILKAAVTTILFSLCFSIPVVQAATSVGKAIISIGKVSTISKAGVEGKLKRRGKVFEGDTINVGDKSRLQLRFVDNQLVVLKANTVFRIDEYKFKDKNDKNKSAVVSLLKGGMRGVTGLIGKSSRDKYKVKTPVATMGVRGTHYILQLCSGQCGPGIQGLVGTVLEGGIELVNDGGTRQFGTDQFFNVPSNDEPPKTITNPPPVLVARAQTVAGDGDGGTGGDGTGGDGTGGDGTGGDGTGGDGTGGDGTGGDGTGGDGTGGDGTGGDGTTTFTSGGQTTVATTAGTITTTGATPPGSFIVGSQAPLGALLVVSGDSGGVDGAGGIVIEEGGNGIIDIATVGMVGNQPVLASAFDGMSTIDYAISDTTTGATEIGGNGMLGVNWGRWASSDVAFKDDGVDTTLLNGLAFIYSDNATPLGNFSGLVGLGSVQYDLMNGPSIRDESGALVTGSASFMVDFMGMQISSFTASLSGNMRSYSITGTTPVSFSAFLTGTEVDLMGSCSGGACGGSTTLTGTAGGAFIGSAAEALIGYFGVNNSGGTIGINGVGVFEDCGC